ncbi:RNA polymerase factor sigma-54 [Larsenimonas rhizosphaerae]|uniref:RNA polymerase sigma-54 factor n=1 Tax=Larsenimonas rhizosphaerae TaxID=2944682 RepID=A0AA41ZEF3_9GAMM|nr:RNA polymerase factor sigma-54 [Larsenimonas rhizosphaerae]MCX2523787.1 RNA polymerase factor sigma-54 [Larsenimonas rhizosphaerae]
MTMKPSLQLRVGAHLTMTPQLQQAIHLLQLSTLDLRQEIQQALDSNPMLEQEDLFDECASPADNDDDWQESIPDELSQDSSWEDSFQDASLGSLSSSVAPAGESDIERNTSEDTLQQHVEWQVMMLDLDDQQRAIAERLIDALDPNGLIAQPLEDITEGLRAQGFESLSVADVERTAIMLQQCEPAGLFARDLRECLLLQLDQLPQDTPLLAQARRLIRQFLEALGNGDTRLLKRRLGIDDESLERITCLIKALDPHPGRQFDSTSHQYVIPDLTLRHSTRHGWQVELNEDALPRLRLNPDYSSLVRRADKSDDNTFFKQHLQEARWFIKSIASRNDTLLRVGREIMARQHRYIDMGEEGLKPLTLSDIAGAVDMHESTISRVTTQKFIHTPRGVVELKLFFSSQVGGSGEGDAHSGAAIRARIRKYVSEEPTRRPLSDARLVELLDDQGIKVARRTVAKYREALGIPSSSERRKMA